MSGIYVIKEDFVLKIIGETSFQVYFTDTNEEFLFESETIGTMWSIVTCLTTASKRIQKTTNNDYSWISYYLEQYKLDFHTNILDFEKEKKQETINEKLNDFSKQKWIKSKMKEREKEFTEKKEIK
jgi:hypothetical protein